MAPPDRQPDPYHSAAAGVDNTFGHAGEIAAWVEWLLHPEQHGHDRTIILPGGNKIEHTGNLPIEKSDSNGPLMPDAIEPIEYHPYESAIEGCFTEQFFDPALALSGQLFDEYSDLSRVFEGLSNAYWQNDDWNGKLSGGFEDLRHVWDGAAGSRAGEFLGAIDDCMTDFTIIAKEMSAISIAYGAIIKTARVNLNEAMGKLVDAFHHKFYTREAPWDKILIKGLSAISGAALAYVTAGGAAAAWVAGLTTAMDKTIDSGDGANIGGAKWREIVDNYFVAQMKILQNARDEIDKLHDAVAGLDDRLANMPKLPG
ncbi:hypothetical protein [Actinokineospora sp.]|uniref:hypothetical protein n=1 Tax=Actinokineospora sp. TaxID=1872133 RepID=UPI003D6B4A1A